MENTEKPSGSRKIIVGIVLGIMLILLPAISWFYLKKGVDWRVEAISELGMYGKIRGSYVIFPGNDKVNLLESSVCVIHMFGDSPELNATNKKILDDAHNMQKQFGMLDRATVRPFFKLVMIAENSTAEFKSYYQVFPSIDYATWVFTGGLGSWRTILENGYDKYCVEKKITNKAKEYYALTDTSGQIRRFYDATDDKEVGRMVEHIAMMLPKQ